MKRQEDKKNWEKQKHKWAQEEESFFFCGTWSIKTCKRVGFF